MEPKQPSRSPKQKAAVAQQLDEPPLPVKIEKVSEYIPLDTQTGILSRSRPSRVPVPFEMYKRTDHESLSIRQESSPIPLTRVSVQSFPRLSVTRLLTRSWCELREFYRIYARDEVVKTKRMELGTKLHEELELALHPKLDYSTVDGIEIEPPATPLQVEFEWMFENLLKLRSLLVEGEAREFYTFGFVHKNTGNFLDPSKDYELDEYLPVTGIIDYLRFNQYYSGYPDGLSSLIAEAQSADLSDLKLSVIDVKTRATPFIPQQSSVVQYSKLQIMYYAKFLKQFDNIENSVKLFETYFHLKNIDIDEPIEFTDVLFILDKFPEVFLEDFEHLRDGAQIDSIYEAERSSSVLRYKAYYNSDINIDSERLVPFLKAWKKPVTLRYFILRNAQLLSEISHLIDENNLNIQYYYKDQLFKEVRFSFDEKAIQENNTHALDFWFGKKNPIAIEPSHRNVNSKCKYCDFKYHCPVYEKAVSIDAF